MTHWLGRCERTAECGELECLCGVCTRSCVDDGSCSQFGSSATCRSQSGSDCIETVQICAGPSPEMTEPEMTGPEMTEPEMTELEGSLHPGPLTFADASVVDSGGMRSNMVDAATGDGLIHVVSEVSSQYATPDDDIAFLWWIGEPSVQYYPERVTYQGDLSRFRVALPPEPPVEGRYEIGESDSGATGPVRVARTWLYRVVGGKLESNPSGVNALDVDIVIGQTDGLLFWTPVEIPASWVLGGTGSGTLEPGYHLFLDQEEVDLSTPLALINEIRT